jgi:hypothetical protein
VLQPANVFLSQSGFYLFISKPISKWTMGLSSRAAHRPYYGNGRM